jgi:PIN domain nuclease of toxin-antitoxin system
LRLLLDTHKFLELAGHGDHNLSRESRALIGDPVNELLISAVSLTEIAVKSALGKLSVRAADLEGAINDLRLIEIAYESRHALKLFSLPLHHRDPFDRMLIATALAEDVALVSNDEAFKKYRGLRLVR